MQETQHNNHKVALVTGAARGIGYEIAKTLGKDGFKIAICDINEQNLENAKQTLEKEGYKVLAKVTNVASSNDVDILINEIIKWEGRLDVVVNNAGITKDALLIKMTDELWDTVINVNLKGTFLVTRAAIKAMLKQKEGVIINIASVIGLMGNAGQANYAASKAGIIAFTKSIAKEYGKKGIRAYAIAPGFIQSEMTDVLPEKVKEQMLNQIPLGKFGKPEDVANVVSFLASEKASYITGQVITVDGGMVMY